MTTATTNPSQSTDDLNWSEPKADVFRDAMRCVASTVSLVTAQDERGRHGMAASAVISVSVDPPSMLVAVNHGASIHTVIRSTRRFCVSVLASEQENLVRPFSSSALRSERFADDAWAADPDGLPYLPSAQCALACEVDAELDYGTHTLFVGRVKRVLTGPKRSPLIWFDGSHASLLQGRPGKVLMEVSLRAAQGGSPGTPLPRRSLECFQSLSKRRCSGCPHDPPSRR